MCPPRCRPALGRGHGFDVCAIQSESTMTTHRNPNKSRAVNLHSCLKKRYRTAAVRLCGRFPRAPIDQRFDGGLDPSGPEGMSPVSTTTYRFAPKTTTPEIDSSHAFRVRSIETATFSVSTRASVTIRYGPVNVRRVGAGEQIHDSRCRSTRPISPTSVFEIIQRGPSSRSREASSRFLSIFRKFMRICRYYSCPTKRCRRLLIANQRLIFNENF